MPRPVVRVALPSPLRRAFDYWPPRDQTPPRAGTRVTIPFGKTRRVGMVLGLAETSTVDAARLRPVSDIIDDAPCLPQASLALLEWAAAYYHHPIGEVVFGALPALLRRGRPAKLQQLIRWRATAAGKASPPSALARAPRQAAVLRELSSAPHGLSRAELYSLCQPCASALRALKAKAWVEAVSCGLSFQPDL